MKHVCCYFDQNLKRIGNISPSNFDGKMPNILFKCLFKSPYGCCCGQIPMCRGIYITSLFDGPLNLY